MTSASGGQRSIQLSYGRYAVERGALLIMVAGLSTLFSYRNTVRCFFKHIAHFSSTIPLLTAEKGLIAVVNRLAALT